MEPSSSNEHRPGIPAPDLPRTRRDGIALCLSGGGFRASLFHLGVLRRLHELGILQQVKSLSTVSGGSIISAFIANQMVALRTGDRMAFKNWERDVATPFRAFTQRDLRTVPILLHLLWNWWNPGWRVDHLARRYRSRLSSLKLGEIPERPEFIFCATDLVFGVNWEFRRNESGDYRAGYASCLSNWPVAKAVAASASFPPVFGPVPVKVAPVEFRGGSYNEPNRDALVGKLSLSDGGVYDNMGLEPVWKNHATVLVSDCGAPFAFQDSPSPLRRLFRYTTVVTNQAIALRKRLFFGSLHEGKYRGAYWGIGGVVESTSRPSAAPGGYSENLVREVIANIRTDLDAFTLAEACVLENHGYTLAESSVRERTPELMAPDSPPPRIPHPQWMDEAKVRLSLADSGRRFSFLRLWNTVRQGRL